MTVPKMISASKIYNEQKSNICLISPISLMRKNQAFTLIEVLVAATIIAVLTSIGVVSYQRANRHSRNSRRKSDLEQIRSALEMYRADEGEYPDAANCTPVGNVIPSEYMENVPVDPRNENISYKYIKTTDGGYCVFANMEGTNPDGDNSSCGSCGEADWGLGSP